MLTTAQLNDIVKILVTNCHPEKIVLFGSYAKGTANENSDVDLVIIKKTDLPGFKRPIEFQKALRAGGRRWLIPMDILVYTPEEIEKYGKNPISFIHEIFSTGKTLYQA